MINLQLKYKGFVPGTAMGARAYAAATKAAFEAAGRFYFQTIRPKHFAAPAAREYAYSPRQGEPGREDPKGFKHSYVGRKLAQTGQRVDLIFSGRSMRETTMATITARGANVRISMPCGMLLMKPRLRSGVESPVNMKAEMEAISDRDRSDLTRIIERIIDQRLRAAAETESKYYGLNSSGAPSLTAAFHRD